MKTQAPRSPTLYPLLLYHRISLGGVSFLCILGPLSFLSCNLSCHLMDYFSLPFLDTCGEIIFRLSLLSLGSQEFGALSRSVQGVEPPEVPLQLTAVGWDSQDCPGQASSLLTESLSHLAHQLSLGPIYSF